MLSAYSSAPAGWGYKNRIKNDNNKMNSVVGNGVTVNIVKKWLDKSSSNPELGCLHFILL